MGNFDKIIDSFSIKETLNPKVWENPNEPDSAKMVPKVRKALMKISEKFIDFLGEDIFVEDVVLTGSLANFNWSEYSDFDLHVIVDLQQFESEIELYKELYNAKKQLFNEKHDIRIFGYDVELYAQDSEESHFSSGVYSILNDEWINVPKKMNFELDKEILKNKVKCWVDKIDNAISTSTTEDDEKIIDKIKDKIKEYRKSGLENDGELSYENLVFKFLRRSGHIEKLFDTANKIVDKDLSIETKITESVNSRDEFNTVVNNSSFFSDLMKMITDKKTFKFTPSIKFSYDPEIEKIQLALEKLGFSLPKFGNDGKYGEETQETIKNFQAKYNLPQTGEISVNDLKYILVALVLKGENIVGTPTGKTGAITVSSGKNLHNVDNFRKMTDIIIDELEGGYYHPDMKKRNPSRFAAMLDSGETMFGMDRKHGAQEETGVPAGKEFWRLIDAQNASQNWKYEYMLEDNPTLANKLKDLIVQIMEPFFVRLANKRLTPEAKEIVMSDPRLYLNFVYLTWNGSGWFKWMSDDFNKKVEEGASLEELVKFVTDWRKNSRISRSGKVMEKIFNTM